MLSLIRHFPLSLGTATRPRRLALTDLAELARQRRALARLDADRLDDLGLSHDEARTEAARPIWDVPGTWIK